MKLKIITFLLLFSFSSFFSFAVVDSKDRVQTEKVQNFQKEDISKSAHRVVGQKKIKKRKFRLRDLFQLKKKIKKAKKENEKKFSKLALISLISAFAGIGIATLASILMVGILPYAFLGAELVAFVTGILGLGEIKRDPENLKGKGMALAGIIISSLVGILLIVAIIAIIIALGSL